MRRACVLTALLALTGFAAFADAWDKKTNLTVNETILVPGATLQPGKYVLKLVDSLADRHIVRITNERENEVITTILAIPNYRLKPTGDTQFAWWETPRGNPPALRAWFYPGDNFGQEFAYPKGLSAQIAETAHAPVPTAEAQTLEELKTTPVTKVEPAIEVVEEESPKWTEAPVEVARAEPEPAEPAPEPQPAPAELPATASPYAAYGLAGLAALAAGLALRGVLRH